jgi:glycosyltransferase 2 family protein
MFTRRIGFHAQGTPSSIRPQAPLDRPGEGASAPRVGSMDLPQQNREPDARASAAEPLHDAVQEQRRIPGRFAWIGTAASLLLFGASLFVLWHLVSEVDYAEVKAAFTAASARQIALALGLTALSYLLLTCYDALALRQLGVAMPYRTTALGSFTSYAVSFTLGFPILTGGTVRYWIYAPKGMKPGKVASLTVIAGFTFWLGMGAVLAWSLLRKAGPLAVLVYTNIKINQLAGLAAALVVLGYLAWVSVKRRSVKIKGWRLELPGFRLSLAQMLIGAADVCAGAGVLYVLLPAGHGIGYETFLAVYVFAVMLGIASHSPGGLGVFEATILLALSSLAREPVLGALLLYRLCYYLAPFVVALTLLGAHEVKARLRSARRVLDAEADTAVDG